MFKKKKKTSCRQPTKMKMQCPVPLIEEKSKK